MRHQAWNLLKIDMAVQYRAGLAGVEVVTFAAAVDPAKYPVLSVTAEPGDGNPEPTGPEVLRSR